MKCPYCEQETRVVDSRDAQDGAAVRRRRECQGCSERFTTYERRVFDGLEVRKRSGAIEPFSRDKLARGIHKAFEKRPVEEEALNEIIERIEEDLRAMGRPVVESSLIGETTCERVKTVDEVAYLRFASVYKEFSDGEHFVRELKVLQSQRG